MDNNDSNIKSQQTGGLKLMTVFIAVLALHVVVIGGFTVYHLMSGGSTDADLTTTDKTHKDLKAADGTSITDGTMPDASQGEKSAPSTPTPTPPTEVATIPANPPASAPDAADSTVATTTPASASAPTPAPVPTPVPAPAPTPAPTLTSAPALTLTAPTQAPLAPPAEIADQGSQVPSGPISPSLAPPPDNAPSLTTPLSAGPVHMPAMASSTATPKPEREHAHEQIYTVKITDSYKKIALAHHVTVAELKEANHIKGNVLHTGQKLVIPSEGKLVAESAPASTSTLASAPTAPIASETAAPMTTSLSSSSTTVVTTGLHHHLYTVVKGDTLTKIAHKFKTTPSALMAENGITNPTKLSIGKKLKIPSSSEESRSAKNTPPASIQPSQVQAKQTETNGQLANFVP